MPRHFRVGFGADEDFPAALEIVERVARRLAAASKAPLAATAAG
jgi:hypothetical protein